MKLGVCYMVFDGEELLEYTVKALREEVDWISVTYQTTSYFGNKTNANIKELLDRLESNGLIDQSIFYEPNLNLHHKENELILRNIGLEASLKTGCTHHISLDVDEFFLANELNYAKKEIEKNNHDCSIVSIRTYYKDPTFVVYPDLKTKCSFIHTIENKYDKKSEFPHHIEPTKKPTNYENCRIFQPTEIIQHHMSYVRKDIRKKFNNSDNAQFYQLNKFYDNFDNHQLGGRVCLLPDYLNRKTKKVENIFNIEF